MASTRTYKWALNTRCVRKELGTYLDGVLVGEEVNDLKRVRNNADGHELLAVVAALHHQALRQFQFSITKPTCEVVLRTCQQDARRWASAPS